MVSAINEYDHFFSFQFSKMPTWWYLENTTSQILATNSSKLQKCSLSSMHVADNRECLEFLNDVSFDHVLSR